MTRGAGSRRGSARSRCHGWGRGLGRERGGVVVEGEEGVEVVIYRVRVEIVDEG